MSLVPDYDSSSPSSSSSSISDSEGENIQIKKLQVNIKTKLPTPTFGASNDLQNKLSKTSVFKNPFVEAENAKEAILEKHVKMVDAKDNTVIINGKKICWNYRKGRCRFGHKCKYAHDSDIQKTKEQIEVEKAVTINNSIVCENILSGMKSKPVKTTDERSDNEEGNTKNKQKRKRPGLTQGLIPGKKIMKQYLDQKT
ncbi:zinc finger CCCH domain-containing protein 8 [Diorhabda sublineata]|uniref:zinc finger CCCH domain-containing protein 8 n=1 Tax=Diorhabda sublineata TaxID=1163346 RepID=UPI0024E0D035|nr:zinc finger CCCH domain-containing protein 8 [Diorhabda sublineata]